MQIEIFDDGDDCTYSLNLSVEDALNIYKMQILHKVHLELPSIGGEATITNDDVLILYKNGNTGHGTIGVTFPTLQKIIDAAMKDRDEADNFTVIEKNGHHTLQPDPIKNIDKEIVVNSSGHGKSMNKRTIELSTSFKIEDVL